MKDCKQCEEQTYPFWKVWRRANLWFVASGTILPQSSLERILATMSASSINRIRRTRNPSGWQARKPFIVISETASKSCVTLKSTQRRKRNMTQGHALLRRLLKKKPPRNPKLQRKKPSKREPKQNPLRSKKSQQKRKW